MLSNYMRTQAFTLFLLFCTNMCVFCVCVFLSLCIIKIYLDVNLSSLKILCLKYEKSFI